MTTMASLICATPEQTAAAGRRLGYLLRPGMVVLLQGELGAGKTTFAQGLADGYGVAGPVTSPSFALIHEYRTASRCMVHYDPFRLDPAAAIHDTGWFDYLNDEVLLVIEWPERLGTSVPVPHLRVSIETMEDGGRHLKLSSNPPEFLTGFAGAWA